MTQKSDFKLVVLVCSVKIYTKPSKLLIFQTLRAEALFRLHANPLCFSNLSFSTDCLHTTFVQTVQSASAVFAFVKMISRDFHCRNWKLYLCILRIQVYMLFGVCKICFNVFESSLLCSPRLNLFGQKHSNIMRYYYNSK